MKDTLKDKKALWDKIKGSSTARDIGDAGLIATGIGAPFGIADLARNRGNRPPHRRQRQGAVRGVRQTPAAAEFNVISTPGVVASGAASFALDLSTDPRDFYVVNGTTVTMRMLVRIPMVKFLL